MPLCSRFFHILFVDSDNDKFVTGVEVRPSKHRRQLQPLRCVCGAPGPTHRICAYISRAALLHASHTQAIHPCTPLAPPRIILTASHLRRARTSPSRREGLRRVPSPTVIPTPPDDPLAAGNHLGLFGDLHDELSTLATSIFVLLAVFAFGFSESGVRYG